MIEKKIKMKCEVQLCTCHLAVIGANDIAVLKYIVDGEVLILA